MGVYKAFLSAPPLTRIAAVLFALGKIFFFFTVISAFVSGLAVMIFMGLYVACIMGSIVLSLIDIFRLKKESEQKPSIEDVRRWAKEYNLIGEKK